MKIEEVKNFILNKEQNLKQIVVADKLNGEINKIIIKPTKIKDKLVYQVATFKNNQVFHNNLDFKSAINTLQIENFKQILCENVGNNTVFSISKNGYKKQEKSNQILSTDINVSHNKQKKIFNKRRRQCSNNARVGHFYKRKQNCKSNVW